MNYRSSRSPRDERRDFRGNPVEPDFRRTVAPTIEPPRNRMHVSPAVRRTIAALGTAWLGAACQDANAPEVREAAATPRASLSQAVNASKTIADEYIVVFSSDVADVDGRAKGLANAHGGNVNRTYRAALKGFSVHMSAQAAAALANEPGVESVEQSQAFELAGTQTNPVWGLDRIDQPTRLFDALYVYPNTAAGVNVYIIDSGVRHTHVEFGGRAVPAFSAINDGQGPDGLCLWHGTHVAGIVGGTVYGAAKEATLYSVRAFDCNQVGTTTTILAAIDWVTANRVRPAVAVMSLVGPIDAAINAAVENSMATGVTYVVSAGNAAQDACNYSPANVPGALTVAAMTSVDAQASYTNYGSCVDLFAPGSNIYGATNSGDTDIVLRSGTSQATGFVAGAAAMYLASNPGASPAEVSQALISAATVGVLSGVTPGTPNRLLRVTGGSGGSPPPPPPPPGNAAPTAKFSATCNKASCTFDASSSTDDVGIVGYNWNFGDGTTGSGSPVSHTYSTRTNITVTVTLTVSDGGGLTGTTQQSVSIKVKGR